jgi:hypothetical protein
MGRGQLSVLRVIVILLVSGFVIGGVMQMLRIRLVVYGLGSAHGHLQAAGVAFLAVGVLAQAAGVVYGVRISGYRVGYAYTAFVLGVSGAIGLLITLALSSAFPHDQTGIAAPALGVGLFPVQLAIGFLPAFFIADAAMPLPEHPGRSPFPPVIKPPG